MKGGRVLAAAAFILLSAAVAGAGIHATAASSTTTTIFIPITTTTLVEPPDVSGGGDFEGGFPQGGFDIYVFELAEPRATILETSNGFGGCPGDTRLFLRQNGATIAFDDDSGDKLCSRIVKYLEPGSYEIRVSAYNNEMLRRYFLHVEFVVVECGNGQLEITEGCDDGNTEAGDCCSVSCSKDAAGTACGDGEFCNGADTCSPQGDCTVHAGDPCAGPDGDGNCSESCDEQSDSCADPDPDGSACNNAIFCDGPDTCAAGSCSQHAGDPCPGPDGDGNCNESCNEAGDTCTADDGNGSACSDGLFCTGPDSCSGGVCIPAGNPCQGSDGDLDCSESCNEAADACTGPDPDGSACEDGLFCNGSDQCIGGLCNDHEGSQCPGADGDADCAESCSDSEGGCDGNDPEGASCDDGVFCNGADKCAAGSCSVHAGDPCPGPDGDGNCAEVCNEAADACTADDPNGSACNDGLFCNGADTCTAAVCGNHAGSPCIGPDGDGNCLESCNEAADACTGSDPDGSTCSDGLFCNGADTCGAGVCSAHAGTPCNDQDDCTSDSCNEGNNFCLNTPIVDCTTTTTLPSFVCGDVNGDGDLKASDALAVLRSAVGGDQCAGKTCICDTNGNGSLTASDALLALRLAVGSPANPACSC